MSRSLCLACMVLLGLAVTSANAANLPAVPLDDKEIAGQSADIGWMMTASALVMLMTPGLALFYGGMVGRRHVVSTMMHSLIAAALIGVQWILFGYSLAFGASRAGWFGWSPEFAGLSDPVLFNRVFPGTRIPIVMHCLYQGMFAIITPALISGAFAERVRLAPYCLFVLLWSSLVYDPLAHWLWAVGADGKPAGWLGALGALDFAGGTVVHVAAGFSGLAAILLLRPRIPRACRSHQPNGIVLTLLGTGLLWFGWFGFNAGSALASNALAAFAFAATQTAAAGAGLSWLAVEWWHRGKPTSLGFASGAVAGLVAVTPASGFVTPLAALAIGLAAGVVCYAAVCCKARLEYDDTLDAFGIHGIGGFLGAILTGMFASAALYKAATGSDIGVSAVLGGSTLAQLQVQLLAAAVAAGYSFVVTAALIKGIDAIVGFCVEETTEAVGLDAAEYGEVGFDGGEDPPAAHYETKSHDDLAAPFLDPHEEISI